MENQLQNDTTLVAPTPEATVTPAPEAAAPAAAEATPPADVAPAATPEAPKPTDEYKWSEDWRDRMARGNESVAKRLARYSSPEAVAEALANAQEKISGGQLKTPAPKDNPEALQRWREENGIPQKPEDYDLTLPNGLTLGEDDAEAVGGFLEAMHANNVHPDVVKQAIGWYKQHEMQQLGQIAETDKSARLETEKAMIQEWGANTPAEKNTIVNFLKVNGLEDLQYARLPDGSVIGNNFEALRKLSALAREMNPADTVVPGSSSPMQSIASEMQAIEKKMGTVSYTDADAGRYMELLQAKEKISIRQR